jgi:CBS domain-containing protein
MSPRAAWRLEQLGFVYVYDYAAGKVDWLAAGEPTEVARPLPPRVLSAVDPAIPVCRLGEPAGPAAAHAAAGGWPLCVVVNEARIVAGRLRAAQVTPDDRHPAEQVMEPGPATIRAHDDLAATRARMTDRRVEVLLITTPEGRLLGALRSPG